MKSIDTSMFVEMLNGGYLLVEKNLNYINELNVFPVPDGDTGTNLKITILGGIEKLRANGSSKKNFVEIGKVFSRALMLNARGNSGVIFSQIMSGFFNPFKDDTEALDVNFLLKCFKSAKEGAYAAVMKPVEGTILTVIRVVAEELEKSTFDSVEALFEKVVKISDETVEKTPKMLRDLKIAGVVDSGGFGLARFFEGMYAVLTGKQEIFHEAANMAKTNASLLARTICFTEEHAEHDCDSNEYGYCTEFLLNLELSNVKTAGAKKPFVKSKFTKNIQKVANSVNIVHDAKENLVRVHGHTLSPNLLLAEGLLYGEFINVKVENMSLQVSERNKKLEEAKQVKMENEIGLSAAVPSSELAQFISENYGLTNTINAQVNGNPSVQDFIHSFRAAKAKNVICLLYDSNTIMSAQEAKAEMKKASINVEIICFPNFVGVLGACSSFDINVSMKTNFKNMTKNGNAIVSAVISRSSKTIKYPHLYVEKDDYICICGKDIKFKHKERIELIKLVVESLIKKIKNPELLILIHGKSVPLAETRELEKYFNQKYGLYCKNVLGNQEIYDYFVGIQ